MTDDPFTGPEWDAYRKEILRHLVPKIRDSAVAISGIPNGHPGVDFAVQLGYMVILDKPLLIMVEPGQKIPRKVAMVADEIVEGRMGDPDFEKRMAEAIMRLGKIEKGKK